MMKSDMNLGSLFSTQVPWNRLTSYSKSAPLCIKYRASFNGPKTSARERVSNPEVSSSAFSRKTLI